MRVPQERLRRGNSSPRRRSAARRVLLERLEDRRLLAGDSLAGTASSGIVTWNEPEDIVFGTLLGTAQLNATASMPGTFVYDPPAGTRLDPGADQDLLVTFTPNDPGLDPIAVDQAIDVLTSPVYRTLDGSSNHPSNTDLGAAGQTHLRQTTVAYEDGIADPRGGDPSTLANPRSISNSVNTHGDGDLLSSHGLSQMVFQFGQFLDHDITLTPESDDPFAVAVPTGDPSLDPMGTGSEEIPLRRSDYDATTGTSAGNPRQQMNLLTSFIDGSAVYGSDNERSLALRSGDGGQMILRDDGLLPLNGVDTSLLPNATAGTNDDTSFFVAGDVRSNEQIGLTSMHTLFVREHNYWAERIAGEQFDAQDLSDPQVDEQIYQQARRIVGSLLQVITYNEFLPAVLGTGAIPDYQGYDTNVDPRISNIFATAAFRVGHTMLPEELALVDITDGSVESRPLAAAFFRPDVVATKGIEPILLGLATHAQEEIDRFLVDGVRNFLFGPPGSGGLDLASLNIQRGRDHGLPTYNQVREDFGLIPASSFADITADTDAQAALASVYASVDDVDIWIGGIAEDHVGLSNLGETFHVIWIDQFTRLRDGDSYFYLNQSWDDDLLAELEATTLSDVMLRNTGIASLHNDVFSVPGLDFGDAPDDAGAPKYPTLRDHDGARHTIGTLLLGASADSELDGQPSDSADGDGGDDDGVVEIVDLLALFESDTTASFQIVSSGDAKIDGWIDFNQDGDWTDAGEQIYVSAAVSEGSNSLGFTIPSGASSGETAARFRLSSVGGLAPTGAAIDGEVEDYRLTILDGSQTPAVAVDMVDEAISMSVQSGALVARSPETELFRSPMGSVGSFTVRCGESDDSVTIDLSNGMTMPSGGLHLLGDGGSNSLVIMGDGETFDFTDSNIQASDFSTIDLHDDDANDVMIDTAAVVALSPTLHRLSVIAGEGDHVFVQDLEDWRMADPVIVDNRFIVTADNAGSGGGETIEAEMPHPWQNFLRAGDVNNDGSVTATDALRIINELERREFSDRDTQDVMDPLEVAAWPSVYFDHNGDDRTTALDALRVINDLARLALGPESGGKPGQGEIVPVALPDLVFTEVSGREASAVDAAAPLLALTTTTSEKVLGVPTGPADGAKPIDSSNQDSPRKLTADAAVDQLLSDDSFVSGLKLKV